MTEIERRFIVNDVNKVDEMINTYQNTRFRIEQDYLYSDKLTAIRKRKITYANSKTEFIYTIKTKKVGISKEEIESNISEEVYNNLKIDEKRISIIKDRYKIPYLQDTIIELDVFHGKYEGLVIAEIEFKDLKSAEKIMLPDWFGKEVSLTITNNKLSKGKINIKDYIN